MFYLQVCYRCNYHPFFSIPSIYFSVLATVSIRGQGRAFDLSANFPDTLDSLLSHPALQQPRMLSGVW